MATAPSRLSSPTGSGFRDGLGQRQAVFEASTHQNFEVLALRRELTAAPNFEFELRERVNRLVGFRHASFGRVRAVDRSKGTDPALLIVSDRTPGARLSDMLGLVERRRAALDMSAALCLVRQLVAAMAALHQYSPDVAHGALAPERIVITPDGRLVVVEYVCGAALEKLGFPIERYWKQLRVALPTLLPRCDQRADIVQVGVTALSLILGRRLTDAEYPAAVSELASSAWASAERLGGDPIPTGFKAWLSRALQLDLRQSFSSAIDALSDLDRVFAETDEVTGALSLETFIVQCSALVPASAEPVPLAPPAAPAPMNLADAVTPIAAAIGERDPEPVKSRMSSEPPLPIAPRPTVSAKAPVAPPSLPKHEPVAPPKQERSPVVSRDTEQIMESRRPPYLLVAASLAFTLLVTGAGWILWRSLPLASAAAGAGGGKVVINTDTPGAQVTIDGQARGKTPLALELRPGPHTLELRAGGASRTIPITVNPGTELSQYVELPKVPLARGQLQVRTTPPGASVAIDGTARGTAPLTVEDLAPGTHSVKVEADGAAMTQDVNIEAGGTASLLVPLGGAGQAKAGWISVSAPAEVQLYEGGHLLGTSRSERIMLTAGKHDVDLVNETLGYRKTRTVQVASDKVTAIKAEWLNGALSVNATPWADVTVDGERVGETPIGNVSLPVGTHTVIFRHPNFGEQSRTVTVTAASPARLSVDMRTK